MEKLMIALLQIWRWRRFLGARDSIAFRGICNLGYRPCIVMNDRRHSHSYEWARDKGQMDDAPVTSKPNVSVECEGHQKTKVKNDRIRV
jgi:hypothetical protein